MSSIEEAVRDRLVADATVNGVVAGRVWQLLLAQHGTTPAIRVQLIDQQREQHLRGVNTTTESRVQVDCFVSAGATGDPYDRASDLADAVVEALTPTPFVSGGSPALEVLSVAPDDRRPFYESDRQLVRIQQDFRIWHRPA